MNPRCGPHRERSVWVTASKVIIRLCTACFQETERLLGEVEEVNRTLTYIWAVVQQEKLEILPRSATLILDTVMNVFNTLRNTPAASDRYFSFLFTLLLPCTTLSMSAVFHLTFFVPSNSEWVASPGPSNSGAKRSKVWVGTGKTW